ncbi:MAG: hypothetical protein QOF28_1860 [Actinomycetota bacterium]|jgi:uncharacterized linocin/CFP29 family protein|nr:hypothetical protein [Actinomycetota bacterium]
MNHLMRELAPITDEGWQAVDEFARNALHRSLAARRLVDFTGPHGWEYSSATAGRVQKKAASQPVPGAHLQVRKVVSAVELRVPFTVSRTELAAVDRGASDPDLDGLEEAARLLAHAENLTVFEGAKNADIDGIASASPHPPIALDSGFDKYPRAVAWAVERLREAGINGPYGVALSPADYTGVVETTENGGYPVFDHVRRILGGPIVWGPGMQHGLVVSLRGGDFVFASGEDISIGYSHHDAEKLYLYLEESFTFHINEPRAAIVLKR